MDIDQYRALKAQELEEQSKADASQTNDQAQSEEIVVNKPKETKEETKEENKIESSLPETINVDGIGEISINELKNGYLRQSDYTKKTQEVARTRKENEEAIKLAEYLKSNPQMYQQVTGQTYDPSAAKIQELEDKLYDVMLEREIDVLQNKYDDFDVRVVLQTASEKNIINLEDAYLLNKNSSQNSTINVDELKEQIRRDLLKEIQEEKNATQSIITNNDNSNTIVKSNSPQISSEEKRVAQMMRMSESEYVKWRDAN